MCVRLILVLYLVVGPPEIVIAPDDTVVDQDNTVLVTCVAYAPSQPNISWTQNGQLLSNDSVISIYDDVLYQGGVTFYLTTLEICSVDPRHGGEYSCTFSNSFGNHSSSFSISVLPAGRSPLFGSLLPPSPHVY